MRTGTAQSFLESINTSVSPQLEALKDGLLDHVDAEGICTCACRCGRSPIWRPRGRKRSKSFTAMRSGISELSGWDSEPRQEAQPMPVEPAKQNGPGAASLERLPAEILGEWGPDFPAGFRIDYLVLRRNHCTIGCGRTSRWIRS